MKKNNPKTDNIRPFNRYGFTLVEVLIALSLFIVSVLIIIQLFPVGIRSARLSKNEITAVNLAQAKIESIEGISYGDIGSEARAPISTDPDDPFSRFERELFVEYLDGNLDSSTSDIGLKKITATVFWQDSDQEKNVSASYIKGQ